MARNAAFLAGLRTYGAAHNANVYGRPPTRGGGVREGVAYSVRAARRDKSGNKQFLKGYKAGMKGEKARKAAGQASSWKTGTTRRNARGEFA